MICSWLHWSSVIKASCTSAHAAMNITLPSGTKYMCFCRCLWFQPEDCVLPASSTTSHFKHSKLQFEKKLVIVITVSPLSSKSCIQSCKYSFHPLAHIQLWIFIWEHFYPVLFLTKLREETSMILQPSSYCLLNNSFLHPSKCLLHGEPSILTNKINDIWNEKNDH